MYAGSRRGSDSSTQVLDIPLLKTQKKKQKQARKAEKAAQQAAAGAVSGKPMTKRQKRQSNQAAAQAHGVEAGAVKKRSKGGKYAKRNR